jgi:hypothetical protein
MAVADQGDHYDFSSTDAKEIVADHERSWLGFTRAMVWGVGAIVVVLLLLLLFVA